MYDDMGFFFKCQVTSVTFPCFHTVLITQNLYLISMDELFFFIFFTITPEPRLWISCILSILGRPKKRSNSGSSSRDSPMRRLMCPRVAILTTAGVTFSSIGARLGNCCPSIATGKAAQAGVYKNRINSSVRNFITARVVSTCSKGSWIEIKLFLHVAIKLFRLCIIRGWRLDQDFDKLIASCSPRHAFTPETHFLTGLDPGLDLGPDGSGPIEAQAGQSPRERIAPWNRSNYCWVPWS